VFRATVPGPPVVHVAKGLRGSLATDWLPAAVVGGRLALEPGADGSGVEGVGVAVADAEAVAEGVNEADGDGEAAAVESDGLVAGVGDASGGRAFAPSQTTTSRPRTSSPRRTAPVSERRATSRSSGSFSSVAAPGPGPGRRPHGGTVRSPR
jgi:hypothetical protein